MGQPEPQCIITSLPGIGERRTYRGIVQPFAAHAHDHYVLGLVEEGRRTLVCNGRPFDLEPGDLVVLNPGDVHACAQKDGGMFCYDSIAVDASLLAGSVLRGPKVSDKEARRAFRETLSAIDATNPSSTGKGIRALCGALASHAPEHSAQGTNERAAEHAMAHFCGHLSQPESLDAIARREGISAYALLRAYRNRFSITPMRHLASLRVERACRLLAEGVSPVAVSAEVGFADQPHLTRTFKQRMGVTPAAYQRMVLAKGSRA